MDDPQSVVADAAQRIASDEAVDWDVVESGAADAPTRDILKALRAVSNIAAFHRSLHAPAVPLVTWGSLMVFEEIGSGAFSRVYRCRDLRLERDVALKLLDSEATHDADSGATVVEEGRHLARLRHPNIVTIHGADRSEGRVGLEMELIVGQTFHELVQQRGPLSAEEALLVGRDVCRALAAIHRAGLVHRDVKAQNVMREQGGRVVLMDLGAVHRVDRAAPVGLAGTPLYLAPELLTGSNPTPRSDVYSVGVLLFYLVTASFPYSPQSVSELAKAVSEGRLARLRDLRADLPERFIRVVERALASNADERFDSAGAFEAALSATLSPEHTTPVPTRRPVTIVGSAAITLIAASVIWAILPGSPTPNEIERFAIPLVNRLTRPSPPGAMEFVLSPDGQRVVYSENATGTGARIFQRPLDAVDSVLLREMDSGQPFLSPDGRWVGLHRQAGAKLVKIPVEGDALVELADWPRPAGAAWDRNGTIVLSSEGRLYRVPDTGGVLSPLEVAGAASDAAIRPSILPNGTVLFTRRRSSQPDAAVALDSQGRIREVIADASNARYLPPGFLVFVRGDWIMAAPFDAARAAISGPAVQIQPAGMSGWFDVSPSGSLVFGTIDHGRQVGGARYAWLDRATGAESALPFPEESLANLLGPGLVSPDGRRVAVMQIRDNSETNPQDRPMPGPILVGDLERGTMTPLTIEAARLIAWTPDSTRVTFRNSHGDLVTQPIDGSGPEVRAFRDQDLARTLSRCTAGSWSPDERALLMACPGPNLNDIMAVSFRGNPQSADASAQIRPFLAERHGESFPALSPDGKLVAYVSTEAGQREVYVRRYPDGGGKIRISTDGGVLPSWAGRRIFFFDYTTRLPMVVELDGHGGASLPQPAVAGLRPGTINSFQASSDGRRLLVLYSVDPFTANQLTVVLHWIEEVKRRLGVR